jgi:hypothetical protein
MTKKTTNKTKKTKKKLTKTAKTAKTTTAKTAARKRDARTTEVARKNAGAKRAGTKAPETQTEAELAAQDHERRLRVIQELNRRVGAALERLRNAPLPAGCEPCLPAGETEKSERRTIARLRAGTILPADLAIDPLALADEKEARLRYLAAERFLLDEMLACHELLQGTLDHDQEILLAAAIETLRQAKQLPEATDADSDVAWSIRRMNRARRGIAGGRVRSR